MKFNFRNRKIQKVKYSFLIPLPTEWVTNVGLSKGKQVKIEMLDDQSLKITPASVGSQTKAEAGEPTAMTV
jgi:antitoxin component of MazEF toxin-antitoxin module